MHRRTATALPLALLLLAPLAATALAPSVPAQGGQVAFTVNVVSARSLGCSPDRFTEPDLRVRVLLNGVESLVTPEAGDQDAPLYGVVADFTMALPVRVSVEVQEGEPGGFLGLGTRWVPCDTAEGAGAWHNFTYTGGAADRIRALGDGATGAEAVVVIGRSAPDAPVVTVGPVTGTTAQLTWDRPAANASATTHQVAQGNAGAPVGEVPAGATGATLTGLCDGWPYSVRVLRGAAPWSVSSPDVAFTTPDVAPQAARVLRAERSGENLTVDWESATLHDVARFEVHVGASEGFTASDATLRASEEPFGSFPRQGPAYLAFRAGDAFVKVRTVDQGGFSNVSAAFAVGAPDRASILPPEDCVRMQVQAAPPTSSPTPATSTPATTRPATTPTGTTGGDGATTLAPEDEGGRVGTADAGADEGILESRLGVLLIITVGLLGVAVGALIVVLARR